MVTSNQTTALAKVPPGSVVRIQPQEQGLHALATMSDDEFTERLTNQIRARDRMVKIQQSLLREGADYGLIPGTDKKALFKSGAEKICQFNGLVATFHTDITSGDGKTSPSIRVVATCRLHLGSEDGPVVGSGQGSCNSWERRYRWRKGERVCPACSKTAIIKGQAEYGGGWVCWKKKDGCNAKFKDGDPSIEKQSVGDVENKDPHDLENTIIKMACKRAYVDSTLRATALSTDFTQDLEDGADGPDAPPPAAAKPQPKTAPVAPVTQAQSRVEREPGSDDGDEGDDMAKIRKQLASVLDEKSRVQIQIKLSRQYPVGHAMRDAMIAECNKRKAELAPPAAPPPEEHVTAEIVPPNAA